MLPTMSMLGNSNCGRANEHDQRPGRMESLVASLLGCAGAALLGSCQQQELFPGMEAPTQIQSQSMGWPAPRYINVEEGDNQDPSFDTQNFPYSTQPWYAEPGYLQG